MCKIVRNCAILLQNTTLNLTLTHALDMTLTLTTDPNSNPNPTAIRIYIPHFTVTPNMELLAIYNVTTSKLPKQHVHNTKVKENIK